AVPGAAGSIVFREAAGFVEGAVKPYAEEAAKLGSAHEVELVYLIVARVPATYIVEIELDVIVGGIAVLSDEVLFIDIACGDAPPVGGVGDAYHEAGLAKGEVGADAGVRERTVGEHIGHAIVPVGICV